MGMYSLLFNELREPAKSRSTVCTSGVWILKLWFSYLCHADVSVSPMVRLISLWCTSLFLSALRSVLAAAGWAAYSISALLSCVGSVSRAFQATFGRGSMGFPGRVMPAARRCGRHYLPWKVPSYQQVVAVCHHFQLVCGVTQGVLTSSCPFIWFS